MKPKVYVESSVISFCANRASRDSAKAERQKLTRQWWTASEKLFHRFVSVPVIAEIAEGDLQASSARLALVRSIPILETTEEAEDLANRFLRNGQMPAKAKVDALHIAIAAFHGMDYLVTWNCKHIANIWVRHAISKTLDRAGLACPLICTPEESLKYDN